jgi:hypothetical protein
MAKQHGPVVLRGKLGGVVFYTSKYGNLARMNEPMSKEKYEKSPSTRRRRESAAEFGYAARAGKLLRHGVRGCLSYVNAGSLHARLAGLIMRVVQEDKTNVPGKKQITADNAGMLKGFNWVEDETLGSILRQPYSIELDIAGGSARLEIASLAPVRDVRLGVGATHVEISLLVVGVDYEKDKQLAACAVSDKIEVVSDEELTLSLSCALPAFDGKVLMAGIGVQGWQLSNGQYYALADKNGFEIGVAGVID